MNDGLDVTSGDLAAINVFAFCICSYGRWNGHGRTNVYVVEGGA